MITTEMMSTLRPPQVGEMAPDFSLHSTSGQTVTVSEFRDRKHVLIAFFPLAFTSTCTSELCAFSDDFDAFSGVDVEVLPISVDAVPSLKEFKNKFGMKVDLLSDFRRTASVAYGVLREDTFFSRRAYFLIDKSGVIRWVHVETKPGMRRENEEILAHIRALDA
jgi:peroxiredoxin